MKTIPLFVGRGRKCYQSEYVAFVDDEDYPKLNRYRWFILVKRYAYARIDGQMVLMHRLILNPRKGLVTDHADGNGFNNQRENLRACTVSQNRANSRYQLSKITPLGHYRGVEPSRTKSVHSKLTNPWRAKITFKSKPIDLGSFKDAHTAALMYDFWATALHGEYARTNFKVVASYTTA